MLCSGTDTESYITEYILVCEEKLENHNRWTRTGGGGGIARGAARPKPRDALLTGFLPEDKGPYALTPNSRANSYPWSPFPLRRARPGPGPRINPESLPILAVWASVFAEKLGNENRWTQTGGGRSRAKSC